MIGQVTLAKRMRFSMTSEKEFFSLKPKDVVSMETIWARRNSRYLVIKVSKKLKSIDLLPLEEFYGEGENNDSPVLSVPFSMIRHLSKLDKGDLLFLANQDNPHIIKALENL